MAAQQRDTRSTLDEDALGSIGADLLRVPRALFDAAVTAHHAQQLEERLAFLSKFEARSRPPSISRTPGQDTCVP